MLVPPFMFCEPNKPLDIAKYPMGDKIVQLRMASLKEFWLLGIGCKDI
jgi:hypothetical protein